MKPWAEIPGNSVSIEAIYGPAVEAANVDDVFVELGVYYGRSLAMLCTMAKSAGKRLDIHGFDLWAMAGDITRGAAPHAYEPATMVACVTHLVSAGVFFDCTLYPKDTSLAAGGFGDGTVTLVFVDGDHSYSGCLRDIQAWWPKVKAGGMLAGHDYSGEYPGVMQAVTEIFPEYVHHGERDTGICWWVRKPL